MAVPIEVVPPRRKSTRVIVEPPLGVTLAVTDVAELRATDEPPTGAEREMVGVPVATDTLAAVEVTVAPFESVTRAVNEKVPAAPGVQFTV